MSLKNPASLLIVNRQWYWIEGSLTGPPGALIRYSKFPNEPMVSLRPPGTKPAVRLEIVKPASDPRILKPSA